MIKAMAELDDGCSLVVFGLSEGNVERLRTDSPIVYSRAELGLAEQSVCIAYKRSDGRVGLPEGFQGIILVVGEVVLSRLERRPLNVETDKIKFCLFRGKDEMTMEEELRGLIGPETKWTRRGHAPSDRPPSPN